MNPNDSVSDLVADFQSPVVVAEVRDLQVNAKLHNSQMVVDLWEDQVNHARQVSDVRQKALNKLGELLSQDDDEQDPRRRMTASQVIEAAKVTSAMETNVVGAVFDFARPTGSTGGGVNVLINNDAGAGAIPGAPVGSVGSAGGNKSIAEFQNFMAAVNEYKRKKSDEAEEED